MLRTLATVATAALLATACTGDDQPQPEPDESPDRTATPSPTASPTASPPAPSPTGEEEASLGTLVYIDRAFGQDDEDTPRLVVVDLPDGEPRVLAEDALTGATWSPSGDRVVYIGRPDAPEEPAQEELLTVVPDAGTTSVIAEGNFLSPAWSPDGLDVAVAGSTPGERDPISIAVVNVQRAQLTAVTEPPEGTDDLEPAWSPDGERIAFVRNRHADPSSEDPDDRRILTVAPDGSDQQEVAPGLFNEGAPAWSPAGDTIAVTASESPGVDPPRRVYLAPADGGEPTPLAVSGARHDVVFSPDGQLLAVVVGTLPDRTDIHVVNVDDASTVAVFDGGEFDTSPTWSPDGTHIAFVAASGLEGQADIALGELESGEVTQLTEDGSVESPDFAPR